MSDRTKQLNEQKLITDLTGMKLDMDQLKNQQATSMVSGVLGYQTATDNLWDATATVGSDSDTSTHTTTVTITFNGDGSQDVAFINLAYAVYVNGTDASHQLTIPNVDWTDGTRTAHISAGNLTYSHDNATIQFLLTTLKQVTYYIKAYASASQRGSLGVAAV